jgi:hypothetical protein
MQLLIDIALFLIYCGLTTLLIAWAWKFWMLNANQTWEKGLKWVLLEIKLPREINKSPEAAELFLRSIIEGGGLGTWFKEKWEGRIPNTAALEIASLEGVVHFYIRIETKLRPRIEAAIYSQYPTVEIVEVPDYMDKIPKIVHNDPKKPATWACEWLLSKSVEATVGNTKDRNNHKLEKLKYSGDMYPIKTYKDWGLDKDPKEMYKHDPLTYVIEQLGTIGQGEYFVYQIVIRDAAKWNEIYDLDTDGKKTKTKLSELVKFETDKFKIKWSLKEKGKSIGDDEFGNEKMIPEQKDKDGKLIKKAEVAKYARNIAEAKPIPMTEREEEAKKSLEAIQKKMSKPQVFAIIRTVYVADSYTNIGSRIPMVMGFTKPFNEDGFNTFRPDAITDPFDFPWQDTMKRLVPWRKENMYGDLTGRDGMFSYVKGMGDGAKKALDIGLFNYPSYVKKIYSVLHNIFLHPFTPTMSYATPMTLNVEELATLYHFPGEVAATPTLPRIDSTKSSSPSNLPI